MSHISTSTEELRGVAARAILEEVEPGLVKVSLHVYEAATGRGVQRGLDEYPYSVIVPRHTCAKCGETTATREEHYVPSVGHLTDPADAIEPYWKCQR